jgi:hypothetical protein
MKTRVLGSIREGMKGWIAEAFKEEAVFCSFSANTESEVTDGLKTEIQRELVTLAEPWLKSWQRSLTVVNCPESKIESPVDIWYCKLKKQACPIQGQVFLDSQETFFAGCLVSQERKQQIFDTVAAGKYGGFHHLPGRYLCVSCEEEGKKGGFSYHYPWELTHFRAYYPLVETDWHRIRLQLRMSDTNVASASSALCAEHAKQLATAIDPEAGARLKVFEFTLFR